MLLLLQFIYFGTMCLNSTAFDYNIVLIAWLSSHFTFIHNTPHSREIVWKASNGFSNFFAKILIEKHRAILGKRKQTFSEESIKNGQNSE